MDKNNLRIVYMGTPDFAVAPLRALVEASYHVVAVVTMPDKAIGRGMKIQSSPVKQYAQSVGLPVLQPEKLKDEAFLDALRSFHADLQIVVAFRMLPEVVWNMPPMGTFNLHASLLPQYRGAAPIHWAVIHGEKQTGVTTFLLQHEIDTGNVLLQERLAIGDEETTGSVHDRLMALGAELVPKTVDLLLSGDYQATPQTDMTTEELRSAPKLFKENTRIDWRWRVADIHNFVRGLCPYPSAWTELLEFPADGVGDPKVMPLKIFEVNRECCKHSFECGQLFCDAKRGMKVAVADGFIHLNRLQPAGKKAMTAGDFLRGYQHLPKLAIR